MNIKQFKWVFLVLTVAAWGLSAPRVGAQSAVFIPDAGLEAALRDALNRPAGVIMDADLAGLTSLNAFSRGISDLTGIQYCTGLTQLDLHDNHITDVSPLSGLTNLTFLLLYINDISNVAPLASLGNLRFLHVYLNEVADISPLANLTHLTNLGLSDNQITDITPLDNANLATLQYLTLYGNQISDITALARLTALTSLDISGNQVNDITPLTGLMSLTNLNLANNYIRNVGPLSGHTSLTTLTLYRNLVVDVTPLGTLTNLKVLGIDSNQVSDISPLQNLGSLESLYLSHNLIENIYALSELPASLWQLHMHGNLVRDISPLAALTGLKELTLGGWGFGNRIRDIGPLAGLTQLNYLDISYNPICDLLPLTTNGGLGLSDYIVIYNNLPNTAGCSVVVPELRTRGATVATGDMCESGGRDSCEIATTQNIYVDAFFGNDYTGDGTKDAPYYTIERATLDAAAQELDGPGVTLHLAPGTYPSFVSMLPNMRIVGSGRGSTIIAPSANPNVSVVVKGAQGGSIESLSIVMPADGPTGTRLLSVVQVSMDVRDVEMDGQSVPGTIGAYIHGENSSDTFIRDCYIHHVDRAIDTTYSSAQYAFNDFVRIHGEAAVTLIQREGATPLVGNQFNLYFSGSNIFDQVSGKFFKTLNVDETTLAQVNGWNNLASVESINSNISGSVDIGQPLFLNTPGAKGLIAPELFVTVLDELNECPLPGAKVMVTTGALPRYTAVTGEDGVCAFALPSDTNCTIRAEIGVDNYQVYSQYLNAGLHSTTFWFVPVQGQTITCDDGEGAPEGDDGPPIIHSADANANGVLDLSEVLGVIALFNSPEFSCGAEQGTYQLGPVGGRGCSPHSADYAGGHNWRISLSELLRVIQFYTAVGYHRCITGGDEDGYCPGE